MSHWYAKESYLSFVSPVLSYHTDSHSCVQWCHEALPLSLAYCTSRSDSQQDNAGGRRLWHTTSASDQTRRGNRLGPGNAAGHWSAARMGQSTRWPLRHMQTHTGGPTTGVALSFTFHISYINNPKRLPGISDIAITISYRCIAEPGIHLGLHISHLRMLYLQPCRVMQAHWTSCPAGWQR